VERLLGRIRELNESDIVGPVAQSSRRAPASAHEHVVAVLVPMSGSAGIWGPSCISSAQLAIEEINQKWGAGGQPIAPLFLNSDDSALGVLEHEISAFLEEGSISAIVGMNVSSVRQRLNKIVRGRIPYVYTPLYEGNERTPNVFTIGETPADQLQPAIRYLSQTLRARRWALIGNDYVWPRSSHAVAKRSVAECGGTVTFDGYVPFGLEDAEWLAERIALTRPDIVLVSLVGQDAVEFNRAFGQLGLDRHIFRFSTAIEENILMATGAENTKRLFAASSYFSALATPENEEFKERYRSMHAGCPPVLNALGQSLYEGIHFYAAMHERRQRGIAGPISYRSARGGSFHSNDRKDMTIYLSRADGHGFHIIDKLS
jgi:urea transport system substrate-binding protein